MSRQYAKPQIFLSKVYQISSSFQAAVTNAHFLVNTLSRTTIKLIPAQLQNQNHKDLSLLVITTVTNNYKVNLTCPSRL